jgi:hypothetical protein
MIEVIQVGLDVFQDLMFIDNPSLTQPTYNNTQSRVVDWRDMTLGIELNLF